MELDIKQVRTSSCSTDYIVNGHKMTLWIITGGTPALDFNDYSFTKRYPVVPKWENNHWSNKNLRYDHQDPYNIQGPTFEDVLPNGLDSVKEFLEKNVPLRDLRIKRFEGLPIKTTNNMYFPIKKVSSKTVLDRQERTKVHCSIELSFNHLSPVTFSSVTYWGRYDEKIVLFSDWWKEAQSLMNPLFDSGKIWETLTEEEYQKIVNLLERYEVK